MENKDIIKGLKMMFSITEMSFEIQNSIRTMYGQELVEKSKFENLHDMAAKAIKEDNPDIKNVLYIIELMKEETEKNKP